MPVPRLSGIEAHEEVPFCYLFFPEIPSLTLSFVPFAKHQLHGIADLVIFTCLLHSQKMGTL